MRRGVWPAVAAGLLIAGAGALGLLRGAARPVVVEQRPVPTVPASSQPPAVSTAAPPASGTASELDAPSWIGTEVDGRITLDTHGHVVPDRQLRNLFDYLLTARGERSLEQIKQRLMLAAQARLLSTVQQTELSALFQRYLDYLDALPSVALHGSDPESMRRTLEARKALRRGVLGIEMAEGFFAEDEARDYYEVETMAIRKDASLTPEARAKALASLREQEPPALREVDQRSATVVDLAAETERLRTAGGDQAAVQALREREVGPEAAQRLAALDAERAQWQQRLDALRSEQARILADPTFAPEDRQRQVDALIAHDFSEEEALRVRAQLQVAAPQGPH